MNKLYKYLVFGLMALALSLTSVSCNDDPDDENYYTFTGEMMSDYLHNRSSYSQFAEIVTRAGLMNQLSAYGHYTCFCPDNDAINTFLSRKGKTMEMLTDADCDTIARTHLVSAMYSTFEMTGGGLATQNMMRRPIKIGFAIDEDNNTVVVVNGTSRIRFTTQNDSVENGIMQPIDVVMESSTLGLPDLMKENPLISIYQLALEVTGLANQMRICEDGDYVRPSEIYYYTSGAEPQEFATAPDRRFIGFTAFAVKNSVLEEKYGVTDLKGLYNLACKYYDEGSHSMDDLTNAENPLHKFMAYHVLARNIQRLSDLTVRGSFGVFTEKMNPVDWYPTMLPHTMLKAELATVTKWKDEDTDGYYLNRRTDDLYSIPGVHVSDANDTIYYVNENGEPDSLIIDNMALNGPYFYIDDILKFDDLTQNTVHNCRMRMDFSSVFPELMSNDLRMNGDMTNGGSNKNEAAHNEDTKYGRNFFFPNGYLEGVTVGSNGYFIYRRPRQGYWSLHGDEFVCQGNYDVTFKLPPVPFSSSYQIRLGYAAMAGRRGVAQVYFGDTSDPTRLKPQGIPLDMNQNLQALLGSFTGYNGFKDEDSRTEYKKTLKNKGYRFGCDGGYYGTGKSPFSDEASTLRIVLCTVQMEAGKDYYLRIRAVSDDMGKNNNEAMLDYLELVPKEVWGVTDEGAEEDDL